MGNIEFKRDLRDGQLKVIECNPRLTDAQALVRAAGVPIDEIIYRSVTGQTILQHRQTDKDIRMLDLMRDFAAYLELRRRKELSLREWLASLGKGQKISSLFSITDPVPWVVRTMQIIGRRIRRIVR